MQKQNVLIVVVAWVLSLLTTLAVVQVTSNVFTPSGSILSIVEFVDLAETNVTASAGYGQNVSRHTWYPKNPSSSAILSVVCAFEYRADYANVSWWRLDLRMQVGRDRVWRSDIEFFDVQTPEGWESVGLNNWTQTCFRVNEFLSYEGAWIESSQESYGVTLQATRHFDTCASTYMRNVRIILEVVDSI